MEGQFDMQGKSEGSRNPFGNLEKFIGTIENIKGIKELVQHINAREESVGSGKQNSGGEDDDDMQAGGTQNTQNGGGEDDDDMQAGGTQNTQNGGGEDDDDMQASPRQRLFHIAKKRAGRVYSDNRL
jgi:hypothetical protein